MIYEIRVYQAVPGKAAALRERFRDAVVPRLPGYGIELVGVFVAPEEDEKLTYLTRFVDEAARVAGWASFSNDLGWKQIKADSESEGPLLLSQSVAVLTSFIPGLELP